MFLFTEATLQDVTGHKYKQALQTLKDAAYFSSSRQTFGRLLNLSPAAKKLTAHFIYRPRERHAAEEDNLGKKVVCQEVTRLLFVSRRQICSRADKETAPPSYLLLPLLPPLNAVSRSLIAPFLSL